MKEINKTFSLITIIILLSLQASCRNSKNSISSNSSNVSFANSSTHKRGVAINSPAHAEVLAKNGNVKWFYNWSGHSSAISGMEYVPMIWGKKQFNQKPQSSRYLLGFNEPNFCDQANMTPEKAAEYWKTEFEPRANGRITVSPAVNFSPGLGICGKNSANTKNGVQYLKAFFAACKGCRVDHIAVHSYTCKAEHTISHLKQYIAAFPNKKIWLTEFASNCHNFQGSSTSEQAEYMKRMLPYLDNEPQIFRYAWFKGHSNSGSWARSTSLVDSNMQLTELGRIYTGSAGGISQQKTNSPNTPPTQQVIPPDLGASPDLETTPDIPAPDFAPPSNPNQQDRCKTYNDAGHTCSALGLSHEGAKTCYWGHPWICHEGCAALMKNTTCDAILKKLGTEPPTDNPQSKEPAQPQQPSNPKQLDRCKKYNDAGHTCSALGLSHEGAKTCYWGHPWICHVGCAALMQNTTCSDL